MKWLNEIARAFLNKGYLPEGITAEERVQQIAEAFEGNLTRMGMDKEQASTIAEKFYTYFQKGWYSMSSPVWANYGLQRGLPVSCFGCVPEDNMEDIIEAMGETAEQARFSRFNNYADFEAIYESNYPSPSSYLNETSQLIRGGGGTSGYFGKLRERGAPISSGGFTHGAVHFMQAFQSLANIISQSNVRRGFFSPYLDADHPDIDEFLDIGTEGSEIQNMTTGVVVSDKFMKDVEKGNGDARKIWAKILKRRSELGYPYIMFGDNANNNKPEWYADMPILASNMCVAPETKILTREGYVEIGNLDGENVSVWNGKEFSNVTVVKTGENQKLLKVTTSTGQTLEATPYHKWYLADGTEIRTGELKPGMKLQKFDLPVLKNSFSHRVKNAYAQGFYSGDGCEVDGKARVYLYGEKQSLLPQFSDCIFGNLTIQEDFNRIYFKASLNPNKSFVPYGDYDYYDKLRWLAGLFDSDGCVLNNNGSPQVQVASVNQKFLQDVQLMLQTLGCKSSISKVRDEGEYYLPKNDGGGDKELYPCQTVYRLNVSTHSLNILLMLGLRTFRLDLSECKKTNREASRFVVVESVEDLGRVDDTYCFNEPVRHMGMFNGLLTGQCSEIMLPSNPKETFVCVLSSMNLLHYDDWKDTDAVEILFYFLDTVNEEFVRKGSKMPFIQRAVRFASRHKALGLGVLGWASYLQSNMIAFESREAAKLNYEIFELLDEKTKKASRQLAQWFDESPVTRGTGYRNATRMAIAPTKSSSAILGQVSPSIEPYWSNYYIYDLAKIKMTFKNPYLEALLEERGMNTRTVWKQIGDADGSVQHLDGLTPEEKEVFKTFAEIRSKSVIDQAAARQDFIDQGQSLNLMIDPSLSAKEVNALVFYAWELGIKALYYQHGINAAQAAARNLNCVACEA